MKIRQYTAPTLQEALIKIKLDLGPDAVILHQRKLKKGGFLGFFGKELVEVLAAVDNSPAPARPSRRRDPREDEEDFTPVPPPRRTPAPAPVSPAGGGIGPWDAPLPEGPNGPPRGADVGSGAGQRASPAVAADEAPLIASGNPLAALGAALAQQQAGAGGTAGAVTAQALVAPAIAAEVAEQVKSAVVGELSDKMQEAVARAVGTAVGEVAEKVAGAMADAMANKVEAAVSRIESAVPQKGSWTPAQQKIYDRLVKADLDPALARQVLVKLHAAGVVGEEASAEKLPEVVASFIKVAGAIQAPEPGTGPRVVILVGPTGVGKTTTIAKLAAGFRLAGRSLGLVTIDTYRIAAVEQLKTYGDIIGIPVEVVMTPGALRDAVARMKGQEIILVDTAGRSPSHKLHLGELRGFVEALPAREVHLVLSATATRANLMKAIDSFAQVGVDRLLITKIDEAATLGAVVSAAHASSRPLSYITHGQSVPDDLREAEALYLARAMLGEG